MREESLIKKCLSSFDSGLMCPFCCSISWCFDHGLFPEETGAIEEEDDDENDKSGEDQISDDDGKDQIFGKFQT